MLVFRMIQTQINFCTPVTGVVAEILVITFEQSVLERTIFWKVSAYANNGFFVAAPLRNGKTFSYSKVLSTKTLSNSAISVLKKEEPKRLFNYYDYGAYLIYKDIPVFIDGRADLYSK